MLFEVNHHFTSRELPTLLSQTQLVSIPPHQIGAVKRRGPTRLPWEIMTVDRDVRLDDRVRRGHKRRSHVGKNVANEKSCGARAHELLQLRYPDDISVLTFPDAILGKKLRHPVEITEVERYGERNHRVLAPALGGDAGGLGFKIFVVAAVHDLDSTVGESLVPVNHLLQGVQRVVCRPIRTNPHCELYISLGDPDR